MCRAGWGVYNLHGVVRIGLTERALLSKEMTVLISW